MTRLTMALACGALVFLGAAAGARADEGNPNFRSELRSVQPSVPGLELEVVEGDDALELRNGTGRIVLVSGYNGEPYLRVFGAGKVEVNVNSPARYLNADRFAETDVPKSANPKASPKWEVIGTEGVVEWHDHRIHWMAKGILPPQVKDEHEDAKIFDWKLPITVGDQKVVASGTLFWDPADHDDEGGIPTAALGGAVGGGVLLLAGAAFVFLRRRSPKPEEDRSKESW